MRGQSRFAASAMVGGLVLLCTSASARAQSIEPVTYIASVAPGSIQGIVQDEQGSPVAGAMVSALGAKTEIVTTDHSGRFVMRTLPPGPYIVRAHLNGYIASRGQIVEVRPSSRSSSSIALRRVTTSPVLAAGAVPEPAAQPVAGNDVVAGVGDDDHGSTAWRLRHARRAVLKDATLPDAIAADETRARDGVFNAPSLLERAVGSARLAADLFASTPFSGQVNLLTTGSIDSPQQFFSMDSVAHGVAYLAVGAPAGSGADWTVHGALTQGDLASWIVAGSYTTRAPARHRYDLGLSYAIQRYDGGNPAALRGVTDGSRNAGAMYGFDTFTITPAVSLTYGARYARYDYLQDGGLISPRLALTLSPAAHFRINTLVSSRAVAPGAEEFLPPGNSGIWLPPQRTFSSLDGNRPLEAERTTHVDVGIERDLAAGSMVTFRVFHQHVSDQLVTMFGVDGPDTAASQVGHYFVGTAGSVEANGWSAGVHAAWTDRLRASIEYSLARARWSPADGLAYLVLVAPSTVRVESDRVHDLSTSVEADVPETATHVAVFYRLSNGFAHGPASSAPAFDGRFDVQVHQSLPFMNFSSTRWEMLIAVRNFFRDATADQSVYDELLVVRPPKRVVGGLTLRF